MVKALVVALALLWAGGCKGSNKKDEQKPSVTAKQPAPRTATDPAEQVLLLEAAISKKRAALESLPASEREKKLPALEREIEILEANLARVRAKLKPRTNR